MRGFGRMKKAAAQTILLLLLVGMAVGGAACGKEKVPIPTNGREPMPATGLVAAQEQKNVLVFFPALNGDYLVPRSFTVNATKEVARVAVEKLLAGAPDAFVGQALPEGVKLLDLTEEDGTIVVRLAAEGDLSLEQLSLPAFCATLNAAEQQNSFDFCEGKSLRIFVNDTELTSEPQSLPLLNAAPKAKPSEHCYQVYFSDEQAMFIVPVSYPNKKDLTDEELYRVIVERWLTAPEQPTGLYPCVMPHTELLDLQFADGILTVDLSAEAISYGGGTAAETLFLDSLCANFREFPQVKSLQLKIAGQVIQFLPEGSLVQKPLAIDHAGLSLNPVAVK